MKSHIILAFALLVATLYSVDAKKKGDENWKQRYKEWKSEDQAKSYRGGDNVMVGKDEAASMKRHYEEKNSVWDSPSDDDLEAWQRKVELKKQRQDEAEAEAKQNRDIDAWHKAKKQREEDYRKQRAQHDALQQRHRQPREYQPRHFEKRSDDGHLVPGIMSNPPPHDKVALMARYIVHNSDWAALAYISHQHGTQGQPLADVFSISDGLMDNSTGVPYMFITPMAPTVQDLTKDSRCSLAMTLAQSDYCRKESYDPEDPRCAHVILTGKIKSLKNGSDEWSRAEKIFFDRHPRLQNVPKDHKFRFAKLKISQVSIQDYFGGPAYPTLEEYFAVKPEDLLNFAVPTREPEAEILPGASFTEMERMPMP